MLTIEGHHTGTRFNRHLQFRSGPTADRFLLGEPLGPDADGAYALIDWDARRNASVGLELAAETYRADQYTIVQPPMRFQLLARTPRERRERAMITVRRDALRSSTTFTLQAGGEHVRNVAFVRGERRIAALANVIVSVGIP